MTINELKQAIDSRKAFYGVLQTEVFTDKPGAFEWLEIAMPEPTTEQVYQLAGLLSVNGFDTMVPVTTELTDSGKRVILVRTKKIIKD